MPRPARRGRLSLGPLGGWFVRWSGAAFLVRHLYARRRVSIVVYHDPEPAELARHLEFLRKRYTLIALSELVDALRSGRWRSLPRRPLVITIDDGHAGNFQLRQEFERGSVRPTIFICSQIAGTSRHFWFLDVGPEEAESLKALDDAERLMAMERVGFRPGAERETGVRQALSKEELRKLVGCCELASHGRFHPILTKCSGALAAEEIGLSRSEVEVLGGVPCRHFAYPAGAYTSREIELVTRAGYDSARTVDIGWNGPRSDPYRLKILSIADGLSTTTLAAELAGLKWLARLRRGEGRLNGTFRPKWDPRVGA